MKNRQATTSEKEKGPVGQFETRREPVIDNPEKSLIPREERIRLRASDFAWAGECAGTVKALVDKLLDALEAAEVKALGASVGDSPRGGETLLTDLERKKLRIEGGRQLLMTLADRLEAIAAGALRHSLSVLTAERDALRARVAALEAERGIPAGSVFPVSERDDYALCPAEEAEAARDRADYLFAWAAEKTVGESGERQAPFERLALPAQNVAAQPDTRPIV